MQQMDFEQARFNMIEQQVRPWDVLDQQVLDVMTDMPREAFVDEKYRRLAFADINIPLGHEQVMMAPRLEGRLLQALAISKTDSVLEIGTGSGYLTACLARLGKHVTSVEIFPEFSQAAATRLSEQGCHNVTLTEADAANGIDAGSRYDVIAVTGSLPAMSTAFHNSLNIGGRLFLIVGEPPVMEAMLVTRIDDSNWTSESLFETSLPPLVNSVEPERFAL
ncbi:MAG: protein-L-isoaspartate O-methyltransferase [Pseudomonadota bacterium]